MAKVGDGLIVSMPGVLVAFVAVILTHRFTARREATARAAAVQETMRKENADKVESLRREASVRVDSHKFESSKKTLSALEEIAAAVVKMSSEVERMLLDIQRGEEPAHDYDNASNSARALVAIYFPMEFNAEWSDYLTTYLDVQRALHQLRYVSRLQKLHDNIVSAGGGVAALPANLKVRATDHAERAAYTKAYGAMIAAQTVMIVKIASSARAILGAEKERA